MNESKNTVYKFLASSLLNKELASRYNVCHCPACRNAMVEHIITNTPTAYFSQLQRAGTKDMDNSPYAAKILPFITAAIETIARNPTHKTDGKTEEKYQQMVKRILEDRRLDFRFCHQDALRRRVCERMQEYGLTSYTEYLEQLIRNPDEYNRLFNPFSMYMPGFFIDEEIWVTIKYMLENIARTKMAENNMEITVWNAGAGRGEDAFSLAMLFLEALGYNAEKFKVRIIATEQDKDCLEFLKNPRYNREDLQEKKTMRIRYFNIIGLEYRPKDEIKKLVSFRELNLRTADIIKDTDVILCRNTFPYLNRTEQKHLLYKFHRSLKPQGYIVLGKVEKIIDEKTDIAFQEIDAGSRIYKKK
ncbi:MAG: CheR family methyltransferase [Candidatus Omnitrophota bacterium]|jgi:chemotaxis methyl-accepting protein methylase